MERSSRLAEVFAFARHAHEGPRSHSDTDVDHPVEVARILHRHGYDEDVIAALETASDLTLPRFLQVITHRGGKSAGAIRVSFGIASTFRDAQRFLAFAERLRDQTRMTMGEVTFDIESCRIMRDGS